MNLIFFKEINKNVFLSRKLESKWLNQILNLS